MYVGYLSAEPRSYSQSLEARNEIEESETVDVVGILKSILENNSEKDENHSELNQENQLIASTSIPDIELFKFWTAVYYVLENNRNIRFLNA